MQTPDLRNKSQKSLRINLFFKDIFEKAQNRFEINAVICVASQGKWVQQNENFLSRMLDVRMLKPVVLPLLLSNYNQLQPEAKPRQSVAELSGTTSMQGKPSVANKMDQIFRLFVLWTLGSETHFHKRLDLWYNSTVNFWFYP